MNKMTKKEFLMSKYLEMKATILEQEFAHKFHELLPNLETTDITDVILYVHMKFVGKDTFRVIQSLLKTNRIELDDHYIHQLADYVNEFLQFLELINFL